MAGRCRARAVARRDRIVIVRRQTRGDPFGVGAVRTGTGVLAFFVLLDLVVAVNGRYDMLATALVTAYGLCKLNTAATSNHRRSAGFDGGNEPLRTGAPRGPPTQHDHINFYGTYCFDVESELRREGHRARFAHQPEDRPLAEGTRFVRC